MRFNPPPGWPAPPDRFAPPPGWLPDPSWPPAPPGWVFWLPESAEQFRRPPLKPAAKAIGIAVLVGAVALAALSATFIVRELASSIGTTLFGTTWTTPLDQSRHLSAGKYVIYQRTGSSAGAGGISVSNNSAVTLTPDQVSVTDPSGANVPVSEYTSNVTIDRYGASYTGAVLFHAAHAGRYDIRINTDSVEEITIAKDIGSSFSAVAPWFGVGFLSLVLIVVGAVILARGPRQEPSACP